MREPVPHTVAGTDPPVSNTDESKLVCRRPAQCVDAGFGPEVCSLCNPVFHVNHPQDQPVISTITRNIKKLIRVRASQKGWRTRKRVAAARARMGIEP
jgi:hypothetical protein